MRISFLRAWAVAVVVSLTLAGCRGDESYVVPEGPMPPNTILLSGMMRELSDTPGFTEALLGQLNGNKQGPALMSPELIDHLRKMILGKDWSGLDRFPGWTLKSINPTVKVAGRFFAKKADGTADTSAGSNEHAPLELGSITTDRLRAFLDLGAYTLEKAEAIDLNQPSTLPEFTTEGIVSELGAGMTRGDGANAELAPLHPESQRVADVLNRLSLNDLSDIAKVSAALNGQVASTPEELIGALQKTGHTVEVYDARYFANFGHFHYKGQEVMMPFWIDSQIRIPGEKRSLLVPVSHAEYEWKIRGPKINADVSWYFGIDGKSEFRTMDTLDQAWVLGRH
ncbi:MAG TPA: hypothetical protein VGB69_07500, partial [Edaphobacter sp.]